MKSYYYVYTKIGQCDRRISVAAKAVTLEGQVGENTYLALGIAECSKKDNFVRKTGRMIAEGRASKHPSAHIPIHGKNPREIVDLIYQYLEVHYKAKKPTKE